MKKSADTSTRISKAISPADSESPTSVREAETANSPSVHHVRGETERKRVLMSTAIITAKGDNSYNCQLRIFLDSASETNFISSM